MRAPGICRVPYEERQQKPKLTDSVAFDDMDLEGGTRGEDWTPVRADGALSSRGSRTGARRALVPHRAGGPGGSRSVSESESVAPLRAEGRIELLIHAIAPSVHTNNRRREHPREERACAGIAASVQRARGIVPIRTSAVAVEGLLREGSSRRESKEADSGRATVGKTLAREIRAGTIRSVAGSRLSWHPRIDGEWDGRD